MLKVKNLTNKNSAECVCAIGFFDGIHKGHESLILTAKKEAQRRATALAIFTFSTLPTKDMSDKRLFTECERDEGLLALGVDTVFTVDFEDVRNMDAHRFVSEVLIERVNAVSVFSGEGFRFGRGAAYGFSDLKNEMRLYKRNAHATPELTFENEKISTRKIKELLLRGKIALANSLLNTDFFIENTVVHGKGVGRVLGFPTLNLKIQENKLKPKSGVYKSLVVCENESYEAISNVGSCPTFNESEIHLESYVLNGNPDFYGKRVRVYLKDFIREERKFESREALINQIKKDIESLKGN